MLHVQSYPANNAIHKRAPVYSVYSVVTKTTIPKPSFCQWLRNSKKQKFVPFCGLKQVPQKNMRPVPPEAKPAVVFKALP